MSGNAMMEDAMHRLVHAMIGQDDPVATSLARRVLTSQIGSSDEDERLELASTWRRISRKAPDRMCRSDVETLYDRLEQQTPPHLPPKVLTVLTKLMGKHIRLPDATLSSVPASSAVNQARRLPSVPGTPMSSYPPPPSIGTIHSAQPLRPKQPILPMDRHALERQIGEEKRELEKEETLLLRECLYSLQGIDGERIRYYHKENQKRGNPQPDERLTYYEGIRVKSPAISNNLLYTGRVLETRLGTGALDALRMSGEAGWLYQRIQSFIQEVQHDESRGIVARAFAGILGEELREYHSLLTQYESQLSSMSLRQLLVDLRMPTSRLQVLALMTDGMRHLTGGHLLTGLYQHSLHGDSRHIQLTQSILCSASRPWFDILFTWTTQGVLSDPNQEFFVAENPSVEDKHLWNDKYQVNKDQIPEGIIPKELVGPAFNVGKGINFIRRCLLDSKWSMHLDSNYDEDDTVMSSIGGGSHYEQLGYFYKPNEDDNPLLERTLARAASLVHSHILRALKEDNQLMQHLFALKQFLFLGQGDFFSALMDGLHSEFRDQPSVVGIYKHSLLSIVENALRSTNAKYMPQFVLDRLQVELLIDASDATYGMFAQPIGQTNNGDERTVWDIFMLDYQVPDPVRAIVHPRKLEKYKAVFSLLFCLKRIEFMLNFTWRQSATLQHALQTYGQYNGIHVDSSPLYARAFSLLRKISILRQTMMHLIVNLKSYFMFEVVEGGWRRLQEDIEAAATLDEVILAHDNYINGIVRKSLLRTGKNDDVIQEQLADHVQILLQITSEFCGFQESVFHESLLLADTATQKRIEADRRANQGRWGFNTEEDIAEEENFFGLADESKEAEVARVSTIFNQNSLELLRVLNDRVNANPDDLEWEKDVLENDDSTIYGMRPRRYQKAVMEDELDSQRFLIAQLDHNNFYGAQGYLR